MTRFFRMSRKALLSTIAAAVAAGGLAATPVRAGNDDLARALVGIGAIAIIGTALANEAKSKEQARHDPAPWPGDRKGDRFGHDRDHVRDHDRDRRHDGDRAGDRGGFGTGHQGGHRGGVRAQKVVDRSCQVRTSVRGYTAIGYRVACARRSARAQLPEQCMQRTDASRDEGPRLIYRKACMQRLGWRAV